MLANVEEALPSILIEDRLDDEYLVHVGIMECKAGFERIRCRILTENEQGPHHARCLRPVRPFATPRTSRSKGCQERGLAVTGIATQQVELALGQHTKPK